MSEFTDQQVLTALSEALQARDLELAASLLCVLAVQAPEKAALIKAAIDAC